MAPSTTQRPKKTSGEASDDEEDIYDPNVRDENEEVPEPTGAAAGAYTRPLLSSTLAVSGTQKHPTHPKHPITPP